MNIGNGVQQKETQYDYSKYNAGFGQQHLISDLVLNTHNTHIQLLLYHCMPYLALKSFKILPPYFSISFCTINNYVCTHLCMYVCTYVRTCVCTCTHPSMMYVYLLILLYELLVVKLFSQLQLNILCFP